MGVGRLEGREGIGSEFSFEGFGECSVVVVIGVEMEEEVEEAFVDELEEVGAGGEGEGGREVEGEICSAFSGFGIAKRGFASVEELVTALFLVLIGGC